jgi:hypothetical protein
LVYNANRDTGGATNLVAETEVVRDGRIVLTAQRKLNNDSPDPERIPYGADLSLKSLTPGSYELRVKITDTVANTRATQTTEFSIQ